MWNLSDKEDLVFWVKLKSPQANINWKVALLDGKEEKSTGVLQLVNSNTSWAPVKLSLDSLTFRKKLDKKNVVKCAFEVSFVMGTKLWLDGVRFEVVHKSIGVTDKTFVKKNHTSSVVQASNSEKPFQSCFKTRETTKKACAGIYFCRFCKNDP